MNTSSVIHWGQFRTLIVLFMKMNARGQSGRSSYGRFLSIFLSYGLSSTYLGWSLSRSFHEMPYLVLTLAVTMYLAGFTVLSSYSLILLDPHESRALASFPVSSKTLLLARVVNLFLYVFTIVLPFAIPLGWFYYAGVESVSSLLTYGIILFLAAFWTTGLFIIIYNVMISKLANSSQLLSVTQTILVFLLLFFYQTLSSLGSNSIDWNTLVMHDAASLLPPVWFTAMHGWLSGTPHVANQLLLTLISAATLVLMALFFQSRWMLLPDINTPVAQQGNGRKRLALIDFLSQYFAPRRPAKRAGFDLFTRFLTRERTLRLQIVPIFMMPIAVAVYGLMMRTLESPFRGAILSEGAQMHVPVIVFFLFMTRHIDQVIGRSIGAETPWILLSQPSSVLRRYSQGIHQSILLRLVIPQSVLLYLLFLYSMSSFESALQVVFIVSLARFQTACFHAFQPSVPFSRKERGILVVQRFAQFFLIVPFLLLGILLHLYSSQNIETFFLMLLSLIVATPLLQAATSRRRIRITA